MAARLITCNFVAGAADKVVKYQGFSATIIDSFESPIDSLEGIAWNGQYMYTSSSSTEKVYKHDSFTPVITDSFDYPVYYARAIDWDGTNLLSSDTNAAALIKHSGFSATIIDSFEAPGVGCASIEWDGTDLIVGDWDSGRVYKYAGFSSTRVGFFAAPGDQIEGVAWDGTDLLSYDRPAETFYRHKGFSKTILESFSAPVGNVKEMDWMIEPFTLWIVHYTGASATETKITAIHFNTHDSNDPSYRVKIPESGYTYSFWKQVAIRLINWGDYSQISNIKFYTDGAIWEGCELLCAEVSNYAQAQGIVGKTGYDASTHHPDSPEMTDATAYTADNPLSLSGTLTAPNTGKVLTGYLLLQLRISPSATPGTKPPIRLYWQYDVT